VNFNDTRATTVVPDARNETYYLVVDTGHVSTTNRYEGTDTGSGLRLSEYRANFTLSKRSALVDQPESVTAKFEVERREAEVQTGDGHDRIFVEPAPNRTVRVRTTLALGSEVTVVIDGEGDSFHFEETRRVRRVGEQSVVAPQFDFSEITPGTNFTVTVLQRGTSVMGYGGPNPGTVTESNASVDLGPASKFNVRVTAELSHGGFVVVRRGSVDGELLGSSQYQAPGMRENINVRFDSTLESNTTLVAVAVRDSNGNGEFDPGTDRPYTDGEYDHRVATSKAVTFDWPDETTADPTTESGESPMQNGTTTTTERPTDETSAKPDSPGVPGFGVGVTPIALLLGVLVAGTVATRKRNCR
jgi:hypothetical protein